MSTSEEFLGVSFHGGHSHEFCDHAVPGTTVLEMVDAYLERGFTHFAITEHAPPSEDRFLYPDERENGRTARSLQERFGEYFEKREAIYERALGKAEVLVGFETEYYGDDPVGTNLALIDRYDPDIVVASLHHVDDIPIDFDADHYARAEVHCGSLEKLYLRYFEQQLELLNGLASFAITRPVVIGHLDLIRIHSLEFDPPPSVREAMSRNIDRAIELKMVIEINTAPFRRDRTEPYPAWSVVKQVAECGGLLTVSDDSHGPDHVGGGFDRLFPKLRDIVDSIAVIGRDGVQSLPL